MRAFSSGGVSDHFQALSAHQGKLVDYTTIWLSFNFVSPRMTLSSLSGEWQLRVTHTPLPFINHVHQKFSRALCAEHLGPRKVTRLNAGPPEALSLSRATVTRSPHHCGENESADRTLPPGRSSTKAPFHFAFCIMTAGLQAGG